MYVRATTQTRVTILRQVAKVHYIVPGKLQIKINSELKTCPHCAETDLQYDAKRCQHCGKKLKGDFGFLTYLYTTGVVILVIGGFAFWPLWILALFLAVAIKVQI